MVWPYELKANGVQVGSGNHSCAWWRDNAQNRIDVSDSFSRGFIRFKAQLCHISHSIPHVKELKLAMAK